MLAVHADRVALVREEYPTWGGSFWNIPSGAVEREESPAEGAARELREETGLCLRSEQLRLVSTSTSRFSGGESRAWNFSATVEEPTLRIDDPDGLIQDVRWFAPPEAIAELGLLPYAPLREPAVAYLSGDAGLVTDWLFVDGKVQTATG